MARDKRVRRPDDERHRWRLDDLGKAWLFLLWIAMSSFTMPVHDVWHPTGVFTYLPFLLIALFVPKPGFRRVQPPLSLYFARRIYVRVFSSRFAGPRRVTVELYQPRYKGRVVSAVAFVTWIALLWAGAYALRNRSFGAHLFALGALAITSAGFGWLLFAGVPTGEVTLGRDGVRVDGRFVPYAAIQNVQMKGDRIVVSAADGASGTFDLSFAVDGANDRVLAAISARRAAAERDAIALPVPGAGFEASFRETETPQGELLRQLTSGSTPRDERVRIASILRVQSPEVVEELRDGTADDELRAALGS